MTQLGKFEKYLIEEFFDDYRAGAMTRHTFTRRVAFITGSMAAAAAAMLLVGCTPRKFRAAPTRCPPRAPPLPPRAPAPSSAGPVPGAKSPLSVPEGAAGLATATVRFPQAEPTSAAIWPGRRADSPDLPCWSATRTAG